MNQQSLQAYFNSDPSFAAEYARVQTIGDKRPPLQWLQDHLSAYPQEMQKFQTFSAGGNISDSADIFSQYADISAAYQAALASNPGLSQRDFAVQWANANVNDPRLNNSAFLSSVGLESDGLSGQETVGVEQDLMERALNDYIYPDLAKDPARQAQGQTILDRYNASLDQATAVNAEALDGRRLAAEYDMADQTGARLRDAVNAEAAGQGTAIDTLNTSRLAALDPLNAARVAAADTKVSGINQALEGERDRIAAEDAMSGFVGGSSMKNSLLSRASFGARQDAAETMGAAKVLNATDTRSIWDDTAKGHASTDFSRLAGVRSADEGVANNRKSYFDGDFSRRLTAALLPASLEANRFTMLGAADEYGQSGLKRAQNTLDWWSASPSTPNYATPNVDTYQTQASTAGAGISQLGAGITSAGLNFAMNYKQKAPSATTVLAPKVFGEYN